MLSQAELDEFAQRFYERSISKEEWTHEAHLVVGLWHIERYGFEGALLRLREGIRRLNESHGTINSTESGYHETITRAYLQLLSSFSDLYKETDIARRLSILLSSALSDRKALLSFYTSSRLMSAEARMGWVEPDLAPISVESIGAEI